MKFWNQVRSLMNKYLNYYVLILHKRCCWHERYLGSRLKKHCERSLNSNKRYHLNKRQNWLNISRAQQRQVERRNKHLLNTTSQHSLPQLSHSLSWKSKSGNDFTSLFMRLIFADFPPSSLIVWTTPSPVKVLWMRKALLRFLHLKANLFF